MPRTPWRPAEVLLPAVGLNGFDILEQGSSHLELRGPDDARLGLLAGGQEMRIAWLRFEPRSEGGLNVDAIFSP